MTFQKRHFGLLALGVSALAFSGCSLAHPNAMPSGYTYHQKAYKSATPPSSLKINVKQRKYMDAAQAEQFRNAVYNLLENLTNRAGMPPKPAYVLSPVPMTAFYANIDNDLRESMRHIGYALSDTPVAAYVFAYNALLLDRPNGGISTGEPNVELTLKLFDSAGENARMLTQESGKYYIQGAEELNVMPATYSSLLPSPNKVINQDTGVNNGQQDQDTQLNAVTRPSISSSAPSVSSAIYIDDGSSYRPSTSVSSGYISRVNPDLQIPRAPITAPVSVPAVAEPPPTYNDSPSQAISIGSRRIDENGISYDAPSPSVTSVREQQPSITTTSSSRVSQHIEY